MQRGGLDSMKKNTLKLFVRSVALAMVCWAVCLMGCAKVNTVASGGGNDFPNPAIGAILAEGISKGNNWGDSVAMPEPVSPLSASQSVSIPSTPSAAHGTAVTLHIDLSDTGRGLIYWYYGVSSADTSIKNDTIIFLYDAAYRDSSVKNKHIYLYKGVTVSKRSQARSTYLFVDADGDSIINNRNGLPNRVFIAASTTTALGVTEKSELEIDGGKDDNLDTKADNRVRQCWSIKISVTGDTLSAIEYTNYRRDSVIIDPLGPDSVKIRVTLMQRDLLMRHVATEAIFLIFPSDSTKNCPVFLRSVTTAKSGRTITSIIRGPKPDSLFTYNDTAVAHIIVDDPNDIVNNDTLRMTVLLGKRPADSASNALLGIFNHTIRKKLNDREKIFSFVSDTPLTKKQIPQSGSLSLSLFYADGKWFEVAGRFTPDKITATCRDSKGNAAKFSWDRSGNPIP